MEPAQIAQIDCKRSNKNERAIKPRPAAVSALRGTGLHWLQRCSREGRWLLYRRSLSGGHRVFVPRWTRIRPDAAQVDRPRFAERGPMTQTMFIAGESGLLEVKLGAVTVHFAVRE